MRSINAIITCNDNCFRIPDLHHGPFGNSAEAGCIAVGHEKSDTAALRSVLAQNRTSHSRSGAPSPILNRIASRYWDSLGMLYGTFLYFSGLAALASAYRNLLDRSMSAGVASVIPIGLLPALIGLIGSIHGYISVHYSISSLGASINQTEMSSAQVTVLAPLLIGLCFSLIPLLLVSITGLFRRNVQPSLAQTIQHGRLPETSASDSASDG